MFSIYNFLSPFVRTSPQWKMEQAQHALNVLEDYPPVPANLQWFTPTFLERFLLSTKWHFGSANLNLTRSANSPAFYFVLSGMYYGVSICLVSFASGLSVVTLNIYHRGVRGSAVPKIIRTVVLDKLAPLVFMRFETNNRHRNSQIQVRKKIARCSGNIECVCLNMKIETVRWKQWRNVF